MVNSSLMSEINYDILHILTRNFLLFSENLAHSLSNIY